MRSFMARNATPANVLSTLALFVALGGTGYAAVVLKSGSVTSKALAANSVTTPKITNGAVTGSKIAKGAVGASKVTAGTLTAAQFAPGVLGGVAAGKITVVTGQPLTVPPFNTAATAIATCAAGQKAIAGGFNVGSYAAVDSTGPTTDGNGWQVQADTASSTATINAIAVCVAP
jgi:hypothetical protein